MELHLFQHCYSKAKLRILSFLDQCLQKRGTFAQGPLDLLLHKSLQLTNIKNVIQIILPIQLFWIEKARIITGRNEVVAKVMFLLVSVILLTVGVGSASVHAGISPPPWEPDLPLGADTPWEQTPPGSRHPPGSRPPMGSRLRHTVNERPVRILLECILVIVCLSGAFLLKKPDSCKDSIAVFVTKAFEKNLTPESTGDILELKQII